MSRSPFCTCTSCRKCTCIVPPTYNEWERTNAWHCPTCRLPLERQDCTGRRSAITQWQDRGLGPHATWIATAACSTARRHHSCRLALPRHPAPSHRQHLPNRRALCGRHSSRNGVAATCTSEPRDCGCTHSDLLSAGQFQVSQTPWEQLSESVRTIRDLCIGAKEGAGENTRLGWTVDDSLSLFRWQMLRFSMCGP